MGQANCCCGSREALADAEPVLSAGVRLSRGRKRSERRLLLLREELVVAKLRRGTSLRPQLRLALDRLWVLSGGAEAEGEEAEEEDGSGEGSNSLILAWPTGSCLATFESRAVKELWVGTLLGQPEGAKRARVTRLPSIKLLEKELSRRRAWRTLGTRSLETLIEGQAKDDAKQGPPLVPSGNGGGRCHFTAGGSGTRRRRRGLPWPFALRRTPATAQAPGQAGSGCSRVLFGQPLAALCGEDGTLPRPVQELLDILHQQGPSTEGIFRRAASTTALRELKEALDSGADVDLGSQPVLLLALLLKDFLRSIPAKLLVTDLYEDWMRAMEKPSKQAKVEELKAVAGKLPAANLLLLQRLLSLLQHIGHNASTSRMSCSNLAICVGPNLLSPAKEELLPLEAMLEATEQVKALVEFLTENCCGIFGEEMAGLSGPSAEESPAPMGRSAELPLEEQCGPAGEAGVERRAKSFPDAAPSLLVLQKAAGAEAVVGSETAEAPGALPPTTPETVADSLGCREELRSLLEERRSAGSPQENENGRKRKRKEAWAEELECHQEQKRRRREKGRSWKKAGRSRRRRFPG